MRQWYTTYLDPHMASCCTLAPQVALGMANVGGGEVQYDQRLFNQDVGMGSGFGADDSYNMYDKPLFADRGSHLFKASRAAADDEDDGGAGAGAEAGPRTDRFRPDKGFQVGCVRGRCR